MNNSGGGLGETEDTGWGRVLRTLSNIVDDMKEVGIPFENLKRVANYIT